MVTETTARAAEMRVPLRQARIHGALSGFTNLLGKELADWFRTRRWLIHLLIWVGLYDGAAALSLLRITQVQAGAGPPAGVTAPYAAALYTFFALAGLFVPSGVITALQDAVIGEKESGTAAWVLSKPVARASFLLAKIAGHGVAFGLLGIFVPGLIAYVMFSLAAGAPLPAPPFALGMGLLGVTALFFITLTLMLGVIMTARGPMRGASLAVWLAPGALANVFPLAGLVIPVRLGEVGAALTVGAALPNGLLWGALGALILSAIFTGVSFWWFRRQEL